MSDSMSGVPLVSKLGFLPACQNGTKRRKHEDYTPSSKAENLVVPFPYSDSTSADMLSWFLVSSYSK